MKKVIFLFLITIMMLGPVSAIDPMYLSKDSTKSFTVLKRTDLTKSEPLVVSNVIQDAVFVFLFVFIMPLSLLKKKMVSLMQR